MEKCITCKHDFSRLMKWRFLLLIFVSLSTKQRNSSKLDLDMDSLKSSQQEWKPCIVLLKIYILKSEPILLTLYFGFHLSPTVNGDVSFGFHLISDWVFLFVAENQNSFTQDWTVAAGTTNSSLITKTSDCTPCSIRFLFLCSPLALKVRFKRMPRNVSM